ncbi:uncharacterized protein LOC110812376 [Carica papaya]|uniref:uncharacterized protein LOC110812376 n=1 Tax=Carica papaya TaxID=3649 RepID=UPI000B8CF66E|nr:uncharacterized protein LOC110812376 [Carica papaya]
MKSRIASNKERIENLEQGLGGLQESVSRLEVGMTGKPRLVEENLQRFSDTMMSSREAFASNSIGRLGQAQPVRDDGLERIETGRQNFYSKVAKLEFPTFAGDDSTKWFNWTEQFFELQGTTDSNNITLAAFHLEGEANQWL